MTNEFSGKRYTTIVHQRLVYNSGTGKNYEYPPVYGVYDNKTSMDVIIPGFNPMCYEDIRKKAIELNGD